MKKIITTVSLAAFGATGLQALDLSPSSPGKIWSVSAALRGFYDDNYITAPDRSAPGFPEKRSSWGLEVAPSLNLSIPLEQTFIGLGYTYRFVYFEDRDFKGNPEDPFDQGHQANLRLDHNFSETSKLSISDTFIVTQEPTLVDPDALAVFTRTEADILRNTAAISYSMELSRLFGIVLGYSNNFYDYEQEGVGSRSALLDRMRHQATFNLRYQAAPRTVGVLGYEFGRLNYTSDDPLTTVPILRALDPTLSVAEARRLTDPAVRDNYSHYVYAGVDQELTSQLSAAVRLGAQITVYDNLPSSSDDTKVSPYGEGSLKYVYASGSYAQIGARHARNQTDIAFLNSAAPTLDQESTTAYASVNHAITAKLKGSLLAQMQYSRFEGGRVVDEQVDVFYMLGVNLAYHFNPHLAIEAGYNYDRLDSDVGYVPGYNRSYDRNRVYIGLRGTL